MLRDKRFYENRRKAEVWEILCLLNEGYETYIKKESKIRLGLEARKENKETVWQPYDYKVVKTLIDEKLITLSKSDLERLEKFSEVLLTLSSKGKLIISKVKNEVEKKLKRREISNHEFEKEGSEIFALR